jgi:hypothetical protein
MAFLYPELPRYTNTEDLTKVYDTLLAYAGQLKFLLEARDIQVDAAPATKVYTVVSVSEIGRPANGDIAFSASASKFRGYVEGTGWVDFN